MIDSDSDEKRLTALAETGLLDLDRIPPFEEAVQTVASALEMPIAIVGLLDRDWQWIEAKEITVDDETLSLASLTRIKRSESFCTHVVATQQPLVVRDTAAHPDFAHRLLVGQYGVRAYLGVPLMSASGDCLGTLAVMDLAPRRFRRWEVQMMEMAARLAMCELERPYTRNGRLVVGDRPTTAAVLQPPEDLLSTAQVKAKLLDRLLQELRTPLTSVMGMTSVLNREIYGPLRRKQKEYLKIIHDSGQYLLSLVEEILQLKALNDVNSVLSLTSVDMEMLCQQVSQSLEPVARRRDREVLATVETGDRLWTLDKNKIQQVMYHLAAHVIQVSETGCIIRIAVDRTSQGQMELSVWAFSSKLGDYLPDSELKRLGIPLPNRELPAAEASSDAVEVDVLEAWQGETSDRNSLGLQFACQLARLHGGTTTVRGSQRQGYRYVVKLGNR